MIREEGLFLETGSQKLRGNPILSTLFLETLLNLQNLIFLKRNQIKKPSHLLL
jgi:hypothetical protein